MAIGLVQPNLKDSQSHALVMMVDVTGKHPAADGLLDKITKNLTAKGAVKKLNKVGEDTLIQFTLPLKKEQKVADHAVYVLHGDTLLVADQMEVILGMLARIAAPKEDTLQHLPGFNEVFTRVAKASADLAPHLRWFVDPLGFAETNRAATGGRKKKGTDPLVVLRKHGFGDLQGIGGFLHFATSRHETLYRTFIYAPLPQGPKGGEKKFTAAGILDFPNAKNLEVQPWVPHGVSTYLTWNWKMAKSFEYFGPLFDGFTEDGTFDEILAGMAEDPAGPQIDIRKELIALLGERVTLLTDYHLPIDANCERLLVAFELKSRDVKPDVEKAALEAIRKLMKAEPNARKIDIEGQEVWEVVERLEEAELPMIQIDGPGFVAFEPKAAAPAAGAAAAASPSGIVVAVSQGQIFVGTHLDFLTEVLKPRLPAAQLSASKDFMVVDTELKALGSLSDSFRFFTRTDEAYRPTYELLQQGKLPTAETLLARGLNRILTSDKKGAVRKPVIVGKNMPPFASIRQFFGPGGFFIHTEGNGWFVTGCLLKTPVGAIAKKPE